jgi:hypothetical protein
MKLVKGLLLVTLTLPAMVCAMEKGDLEAVFGTQQDAIVGMVSSGGVLIYLVLLSQNLLCLQQAGYLGGQQ